MTDLARDVVETVLVNLKRRKGIGDELEMIERDIYEEMVEDLVDEVAKVLPE